MLSRDSGMQAQIRPPPKSAPEESIPFAPGKVGWQRHGQRATQTTGSELLLPSLWNGMSS